MTSSKFVLSLISSLDKENDREILEYIYENPPHFDSRVFNLETNEEILENIYWRQSDCRRNSISLLSFETLPSEVINGLKEKEQLEAQRKIGVDWNTYNIAYRYGTFIKRCSYLKNCEEHSKEVLRKKALPISRSLWEWNIDEVEKLNWLCEPVLDKLTYD